MNIFVPKELSHIEGDLRRFFDAMIYKLRKNRDKGRWENLSIEDALKMLRDEVSELDEAIAEGSTIDMILECADVANFGLILSSIALEQWTHGLAGTAVSASATGRT